MRVKDQNGLDRFEMSQELFEEVSKLFTDKNCKKESFHYGIREVWLINKPIEFNHIGLIVFFNPGDYFFDPEQK